MVKKQILLVDGDIIQAERLKRHLELENYIVDVAYLGTEALATLERKWFDLIISSIALQGTMNGIQLLQEVKKQKEFDEIPTIVITSKVNLAKAVYGLGATLFVEKPYDVLELIKKVKDIFPEH